MGFYDILKTSNESVNKTNHEIYEEKVETPLWNPNFSMSIAGEELWKKLLVNIIVWIQYLSGGIYHVTLDLTFCYAILRSDHEISWSCVLLMCTEW